jgi:hypothetical protein
MGGTVDRQTFEKLPDRWKRKTKRKRASLADLEVCPPSAAELPTAIEAGSTFRTTVTT